MVEGSRFARSLHVLRKLFAVLREFVQSIAEHELLMNAAASAFFLFLSIPPSLLAMVSAVSMIPIDRWTQSTSLQLYSWFATGMGWLLPARAVDALGMGIGLRLYGDLNALQGLDVSRVLELLEDLLAQTMPADLVGSAMVVLEDILDSPQPGLLTASFAMILWSAGGATRSFMRALSSIYQVRARSLVARSAVSLGLTIGFLFVWAMTVALIPVSNTMAHLVVEYFGLDQGVLIAWSGANWIVGGAVVFGSVLFLNRFGPDVPLRIYALIPGSLLAIGLCLASSYGLGKWMEHSWSTYNSTYGALAVVIVLLIWCYLMAIGILMGAEVNTAILRLRRSGLEHAGDSDLEEATRVAVEDQIEAIPFLEESARKRSTPTDQTQ